MSDPVPLFRDEFLPAQWGDGPDGFLADFEQSVTKLEYLRAIEDARESLVRTEWNFLLRQGTVAQANCFATGTGVSVWKARAR